MKYLPYAVLGILIITVAGTALLILNDKRSKKITLQFDPVPEKTAEHKLISQALNDPDTVIPIDLTENENAPVEAIILPSKTNLPAGGTHSQRAPELIPSALDTDAQNLYLSGVSLRKDDFVDTSSSKNLSTIRTLIRKSEQSVE